MIFKEDIVKYRHGPVVPEVYDEYQEFIGGNINKRQETYTEFGFDDKGNFTLSRKPFNPDIINQESQDTIRKIVIN